MRHQQRCHCRAALFCVALRERRKAHAIVAPRARPHDGRQRRLRHTFAHRLPDQFHGERRIGIQEVRGFLDRFGLRVLTLVVGFAICGLVLTLPAETLLPRSSISSLWYELQTCSGEGWWVARTSK